MALMSLCIPTAGQQWRTDLWGWGTGKGRMRWCMARAIWKLKNHMQTRQPVGICCMAQGTQAGPL